MGTFDGPGLRLVVFLQGCNFRCLYCANPDTIDAIGESKPTDKEAIVRMAVSQKVFFGKRGGITFSGGEPTFQAKELIPLFKRLKEEKIHICLDSNGGIWNKLENAIQDLAGGRDTVYVVTGPVFQTVGGNEDVKWIQPKHDSKQAPVPNYYWKAVLKVKRSGDGITEASAIGFWFEHRQYSDSYDKHAVSVDFIEEKTGLDLFAALPDELESGAEAADDWDSFRNF